MVVLCKCTVVDTVHAHHVPQRNSSLRAPVLPVDTPLQPVFPNQAMTSGLNLSLLQFGNLASVVVSRSVCDRAQAQTGCVCVARV